MKAFGTLLKIGGAAGVATVNCRKIDGPKFSTAVINEGAHDSPSGFVEKVPGMKDGGQITLEILFDPSEATHGSASGGLWKLWNDQTVEDFALIFPTTPAKGYTFEAFVVGYEPSAPYDDSLTAQITLEITGAVAVYTAS